MKQTSLSRVAGVLLTVPAILFAGGCGKGTGSSAKPTPPPAAVTVETLAPQTFVQWL